MAVIVGVGETQVGKLPGRSSLDLHVAAVRAALADAGLRLDAVDGLLTAGSRTEPHFMHSLALAECLGLRPRYTATIDLGGAASCRMLADAASAVDTGRADVVLVAAGDNLLTGLTQQRALDTIASTAAVHPDLEAPYGPPVIAMYGLVAQRHMALYGTTDEQLALVTVAAREHAARNPQAHKQRLVSVADVLASDLVSAPLRRLHCSPVSDGAGALIVTTAERARDLDARPVAVLGYGEQHECAYTTQLDDVAAPGGGRAYATALGTAGLGVDDVDALYLYDAAAISVIVQLEELGVCARGEGGAYVAKRGLGLDSPLPVNTHGGLLAHGHPGKPGGLFHITEAVRQIRGDAGPRQIADCAVALVHGSAGAMVSHAVVALGRDG